MYAPTCMACGVANLPKSGNRATNFKAADANAPPAIAAGLDVLQASHAQKGSGPRMPNRPPTSG
eukprot:CAMPEP_0204214400 /NCGR_PEP_ID=MMETSP0361-20130328/76698_1 /ASSEMBLY_ACC=CAM_ASM_000343 /TAXON_ID=268821 /ORGANISM="Scrippsiella Hangoei, Strain SHTV-5" /LENGTH=63 /DNA_ID=CAMNT_0051179017 /DNA_START=183 /DNA_END=374 /DNA_ORIENTATION=-